MYQNECVVWILDYSKTLRILHLKRYINDPKFIEDWTKDRDGVLKSVQRSSMSK